MGDFGRVIVGIVYFSFECVWEWAGMAWVVRCRRCRCWRMGLLFFYFLRTEGFRRMRVGRLGLENRWTLAEKEWNNTSCNLVGALAKLS